MADETIEVEFLVKTQKAIEDTVRFTTQVEALKLQLKEVAAQAGSTFDQAAAGMKTSFKSGAGMAGVPDASKVSQFNKLMTTALREVKKETKEAENAAKSLDKELRQKPADASRVQKAFSSLASVAKYAFGTVLGITAISAIRDLVNWFKQAEMAGEDYMQSLYKLTTSVHALQRVGFNITMQETIDMIEELSKQFGTFTKKQLVDGVGMVQLLTRSFGFTKEQMKQTFEIASTLSIVLGKDFNEAARETALFLSSGYAESMQKAGLAVNRKTVQDEAHRLGIEKSYMAMSEQERSMAALSLLYREIGPLMGDVNTYQQEEIGQIKDITSDYQDLSNEISLKLVPAKLAFLKLTLQLMDAFQSLNGLLVVFKAQLYASVVTPMLLANNVMKEFTDGTFNMGNALNKTIEQAKLVRKGFVEMNMPKDMGEAWKEQLGEDLPQSEWGSMPLLSEDDADKQTKVIEDMFKDIDKLRRDYEKDYAKAGRELTQDMGTTSGDVDQLLNIWNNYFDSVDQITVEGTEAFQDSQENGLVEYGNILNEGLNKAMDIWIKYYDRIADIARKEQQDIADENVEYGQKIEDANRDAQEAEADAARKYREEELKAEREFQEKLRRLKEQYLFDLEDALRERDALQVLRLMRKYAMDKANIIKENEDDAEARKEAYQRELEDIARQRERKLQELAIEHQRRLAEIALQAERERAEAQRNRDQDLEDLKADLEQQRAERMIKYEEELQDLKDRFAERLAEVMIGLADEEGMTKEMLDKIGQLYLNMFGKDGIVDISYKNLQQMMADATAQAQTAFDQIQALAEAAAQTAASMAGTAATAMNPGSTSQIQQANLTGAGAPKYTPYANNYTPAPAQYYPAGHALGGIEYANTPTMALFGEGGPELATFTPINRLNTNNLGLPSPYYGGGAGQSGESKMRVMIHLSPGLVGEIVDQAMGGFAQIIEER